VKVIYDFGCNNGIDIPYFLRKGDKLVVVDANPAHINEIKSVYREHIDRGVLVAIDNIITTQESGERLDFFLHKKHNVRSTMVRPQDQEIHDFEVIKIKTKNALEIIQEHGLPYYVKTDLEGYDEMLLEYLLKNNIRPSFISAEMNNINIFSLLHSIGGYQYFNIVDGSNVHIDYKTCRIQTNNGVEEFSFKEHSAGPFGNDISTKWMNADNIIRRIAMEKYGWKDLHATNERIERGIDVFRMKRCIFKKIIERFTFGLIR